MLRDGVELRRLKCDNACNAVRESKAAMCRKGVAWERRDGQIAVASRSLPYTSPAWTGLANKQIDDKQRIVVVQYGPIQDHHRAVSAAIRKPTLDWRRPVGRPRHTWLRAMESDLINFMHQAVDKYSETNTGK